MSTGAVQPVFGKGLRALFTPLPPFSFWGCVEDVPTGLATRVEEGRFDVGASRVVSSEDTVPGH